MRHSRTATLGIWAVAAAAATLRVLAPAGAAEVGGQSRAVARFDRISTNGAFTVHVTAGSARQSLTVSGDPSTVARVTTTVADGTLSLGMTSGTNFLTHLPVIDIEVPVLRGYDNAGAGSATIEGLTGGNLTISNAGAATIRAAGHAGRLSVELDGVGTIEASQLYAGDVSVENNGVGRVDVRAAGTLTIAVNGVGEVRYAGNPTHVESHVNGIGRIVRL
jgi:hypothetical protein